MYTDILINATFYENRIALVENGNLREFRLVTTIPFNIL